MRARPLGSINKTFKEGDDLEDVIVVAGDGDEPGEIDFKNAAMSVVDLTNAVKVSCVSPQVVLLGLINQRSKRD